MTVLIMLKYARVYKNFFHAQLNCQSMQFIMLINVKMTTTVGILPFISMIKKNL